MIVITGTVRVPAGALDQVRPAMKAMVDGSVAEAGCIHYAYAEDLFEPGLIWVSEAWRDGESLGLHAQTAHMAAWRAAAGALGLFDRKLTVYEIASSRPL